jgi:phage terminase large subunit-like protein
MLTENPSAEEWRRWPLEEKRRYLGRVRQWLGNWRDRARPDQLPPDAEWTTLFLSGGRGSGKTWAGARILVEEIEADPLLESEGPGKWGVVAPTFADARDKCIEGESGLLRALRTTKAEVEAGISPTVAKWNRSIGEMELHDGTVVTISGADDGATKIQGENLRGCWCDEIGLWKKWETAWDESIGYAVRKGRARRIATGTPKRDRPARALVKRLIADAKPEGSKVVVRRLLTKDNWDNLSEVFKETVSRTANTELGMQELEGIMLDEAEGALWRRDWIKAGRVSAGPEAWTRKVLALDPADGTYEGDEQAWCLAGLGTDHHLYVAASEGMRTTPREWLEAAVILANRTGAAIVVEKNHGGAFLMELLEQVMAELGVRVPVIEVTASDGKRTRAETPSMLYEQGAKTGTHVVHHIGDHPELEDQMCNWTGEPGIPSPDRMDALVWALTELMSGSGAPEEVVYEIG